MKLTCVTAVFNAIKSGNRENLIRCVKSVAALKTEHEHLIYDGASTDGTVELLRELEAKTPGLKIVSEPDTGIYNALNKGVRDAQGEWFYVLGCDDYICHPDVMDQLITSAAQTEIIVAPVERNGGKKLYWKLDDLKVGLYTNPYSHQSVIMLTEVVRACNGFDEQYKICADWDMQMKCHVQCRRFSFMHDAFAFYATGGYSESEDGGSMEAMYIPMHYLGLDLVTMRKFQQTHTAPFSKLLRYAFSRDIVFRLSGRACIIRTLKIKIKMILRALLYPLVVITRPLRYRNRSNH